MQHIKEISEIVHSKIFLTYHIYLAIRQGLPLSRMTTNY